MRAVAVPPCLDYRRISAGKDNGINGSALEPVIIVGKQCEEGSNIADQAKEKRQMHHSK